MAAKNCESDRGSQVIGFSLVAPLLIYVAVAAMQLSELAIDKVTVVTAAHSAARSVAASGASQSQALLIAKRFLDTHGLSDCGSGVLFRRFQTSGINFVEVHIKQCVRVDSFNRDVQLDAVARAVDESKL